MTYIDDMSAPIEVPSLHDLYSALRKEHEADQKEIERLTVDLREMRIQLAMTAGREEAIAAQTKELDNLKAANLSLRNRIEADRLEMTNKDTELTLCRHYNDERGKTIVQQNALIDALNTTVKTLASLLTVESSET